MMGVYFERVSWISGIALFLALLLTLWPTRTRVKIAAILWCVGGISIYGLTAYSTFLQSAIAFSFSSRPDFPLLAWLIPALIVSVPLTGAILLFPWIGKSRAMNIAKIIFLIVWPLLMLLMTMPAWRHGMKRSFFSPEWICYVVLWFRIRELMPQSSPDSTLESTRPK